MHQIYEKGTRYYLMGIATIFIIFLHLYSFAPDNSALIHRVIKFFFLNGDYGVNIFFLLSAYGLCYSYNKNSMKSYYYRRIKRMLPMLLIYCIIHFLLYNDFVFPNSLFNVIAHITGISIFYNDNLYDWFVPTLIFLYLIFPLLYKFCLILKKYSISLIILLFVTILLCVVPVYDFGWQLKIPRLCTVIIGIMTYLYEKDNNYKAIYSIYGWTALLSFMSFVKGAYLSTPAVALLISMNKDYLPFRSIISFLGRHSFEIYLGQALCLNWLVFFDLDYNVFIAFSFLSISVSSFLLWASHYYFWKFTLVNH